MLGSGSEYIAYRSQPPQPYSQPTVTNLRLNVQIKDNPSHRISLIAKSNCRIQQLKRRIEREFNELLQQQLIVSLIEDSNGFTLSNNSAIGEHVRSGDLLFVSLEQVELGRKMNLGSDLQQNFVTLRYVCNSFCDNLLSTHGNNSEAQVPQDIGLADLLPQFMHLGWWYVNPDVVLNVAKTIGKLLTQDSVVEYYRTEQNGIQKGLLLQLLLFWATEVDRNISSTKQLLKELVNILSKLCFAGAFVAAMKQHSLLKVLVGLSKNDKVDVSYQKAILKIINTAARGGVLAVNNTQRPGSNQSRGYVPSFIGEAGRTQFNSNDIEGTLDMINAQSPEVRKLGLSMLEKDVKEITAECCVRSEYFDKLLKGLLETRVTKDSQRSWATAVAELIKKVPPERASQQLARSMLFRGVALFLQESHPSLHSAMFGLFQTIAERANFIGNSLQAFENINSPYRPFGEICLRIVLAASQPENASDTMLQPFARYARTLLSMSDDEQLPAVARRHCLKILSNILLNDDCRYEILSNKGLELFVRKLNGFEDVQCQRVAAKALLNISISSRNSTTNAGQNKLKVMTAVAHIIELMYKDRLDRVVEGYLETVLKSREQQGRHY